MRMNDARGNELHIGDTIVTTDWNGAGEPVLTQHVVHGFDVDDGNVICGLTYREIHKRTPGSRTAVSPVQISSREKTRYALAANTVYRKSEYSV
jgi:hypothetical protein